MKWFSQFFFICSLITTCTGCNDKPVLFEKISASHSGIHFNNKIVENDTLNPLSLVNIYNGGGVGVGDFNNDGLQDLYFTGNRVSNKLFLNKGDFIFDDITEKAGVGGAGRWARGVAVIDINNDGLTDMYICNTIDKDSLKRKNLLYVNLGNDKDGVPHFKDMAAEYGLDIHVQSTMAYFFDYDNDSDLDMYLVVNEASSDNQNKFGRVVNNKYTRSTGRLFRNDWNVSSGHSVFQDVSVQAGINLDGFGHAATIADINRDGWKDIYVSNDFLSDNILYINNHNGTFTNRSKEYFKHTSYNAMGQDIIDLNNDGLADVVELDMNPRDNYRKKMMLPPNNYNTFQNFDIYKTQYQYVRNTMQLNQGPALLENDSIGDPVFSEIGFMSGVSQTDWSWAPLITDFDNDGLRDMIVTNGFPKDVTDRDFIAFRDGVLANTPSLNLLDKIPVIKLANYAFKNKDGLSFEDVGTDWGLTSPSFSNGGVCADLDNDGDMDLVINNINDEAFLYKNSLGKKIDTAAHYLQVAFKGSKENINGLGAWIDIYYNGMSHQVFENTPYRGYLSSNQNIAHFGLGKTTLLDSVVVRWPDNTMQTLRKVQADQLLTVRIADAKDAYSWKHSLTEKQPLFREITKASGITYTHNAFDLVDFNIQTTLPHKFSEYSPALAASDVDGNGLDDLVIGGDAARPGSVLLQQPDGKFIQREIFNATDSSKQIYKDEGILLFDANGDGSPDLYIASGGYKFKADDANYQDRLYLNNGKGVFTQVPDALPLNNTSKFCVRAMDFNNDGKPDLFVSGRVEPWQYPKAVSSFIFRNDSDKGHIKFTDVTAEVAPGLQNIGMVCDALFTDFDNDNKPDLMLAGEWMPVTFLKNVGGKFKDITGTTGLSGQHGWWNSIVAGDFRHTGRMDYVVGNVGLNTLYQASEQTPVYLTAKDFDNNGGYVPVLSLFLPAKDGTLKEFPANGKDDILERIPSMRKRFNSYKSFANATMDEIFPEQLRKGAQRLKASMLQSCYIRNDGNGKFTMTPLPEQAQISALNGMLADDYDGDGNLDILINGNDFGTEVSVGRFDALNGLLLKGDGKGGFKPLSIVESGVYIPGNGKALVRLRGSSGNYLVAASQNKGALKLFELRAGKRFISLRPDDVFAMVRFKNGSVQKEEFYYGSGFLSQSARYCVVDTAVMDIEITNSRGVGRRID